MYPSPHSILPQNAKALRSRLLLLPWSWNQACSISRWTCHAGYTTWSGCSRCRYDFKSFDSVGGQVSPNDKWSGVLSVHMHFAMGYLCWSGPEFESLAAEAMFSLTIGLRTSKSTWLCWACCAVLPTLFTIGSDGIRAPVKTLHGYPT